MIADFHAALDREAARLLSPREMPDIVDFLEGRATTPDGIPACALQLIDKDADYRGPFTTDNCPDVREILRSCVSPDVETTVIVGPTQSFKTTILIGVDAYTIAIDHGPIGHVLPTEPLGRAFSSKRFQPCVDNTPWLTALRPTNPDLYKTLELGFTTGTLRFAGSNSPSNLASFPYKRVIGDETDKFPQRLRNEAGTFELLLQRTGQFTHHNHIFASTPTVATGTIWQAALRGDCRRYYVPCPHCARPFTHRFTTDGTTLVWDANARRADGTWDIDRVARTAHYRCPHCDGEIWENHRRDMLHAAAAPDAAARGCGWQPDPKNEADARRADYDLVADPKCRSYFRSCFNVIHPNRTYAAIAVKHLLAGRDPSRRQNFTNSELGEIYEESGEAVEWEILQKRAEDYLGEDIDAAGLPTSQPPILPEEILYLTAGVDKQQSPARLEYEIVGWDADFQSWGIQYGVIEKRDRPWRAAWDDLDRILLSPWQHAAGFPLVPAAVCIDTGHDPEDCYDYVRRCQPRRVYAVKGSSEGYGQPLVDRPKKSGVKKVTLYMVGTVTAKEELYSRFRIVDDGPGKLHFPKNPRRGYDAEWFRQITAEKCVVRILGGRRVLRFIKPSGRHNEALDIRCYARAALHLLNPDAHKIKGKVEAALAANGQQLELPPAAPPEAAAIDASRDVVADHSAEDSARETSPTIDLTTGRIERPSPPVEAPTCSPVQPPPPPQSPPAPVVVPANPVPNTYTVPSIAVQSAPPAVRRSIPRRRNFATSW